MYFLQSVYNLQSKNFHSLKEYAMDGQATCKEIF